MRSLLFKFNSNFIKISVYRYSIILATSAANVELVSTLSAWRASVISELVLKAFADRVSIALLVYAVLESVDIPRAGYLAAIKDA